VNTEMHSIPQKKRRSRRPQLQRRVSCMQTAPTAADAAALSMCQRLLARVLAGDAALAGMVHSMEVRATQLQVPVKSCDMW
jgi:hypothetical protein